MKAASGENPTRNSTMIVTNKPEADRVTIIAEAGVNHNGDMQMAFDLIEAAAQAGADIVKFQTFKAKSLVSANAPRAEYQQRQTGSDAPQLEMLAALELSEEQHLELQKKCAAAGIGFLSTAFDVESLKFLIRIGISAIKIPSGEITNLPLLREMARTNLPIYLSTGMADLGEIEDALEILESEILESVGANAKDITILHCHTEYPTQMSDANLRAIPTIAAAFGRPVGYSDHTDGIAAAIASVALGARVIEKHLTLDRSLPGPDHKASLEPSNFAEMVRAIRDVELALGHGRKIPSRIESKNKIAARKSIVAARSIRSGEVFTTENLGVKRPGSGISPMAWDQWIGRKATRDFAPDDLIE